MHFISLSNDNFTVFLFFKGSIKKLKKQVKRLRLFINEKQLTDNLPALFFQIDPRQGWRPSKHSGAATGLGD
jgi:hypothetical protein